MKVSTKGYEQLSDILVEIENQAVKGIMDGDETQQFFSIKRKVFEARQVLKDECSIEESEKGQSTAESQNT